MHHSLEVLFCLVTCLVLWCVVSFYFVYSLYLDTNECLNSNSCHSNATCKNNEGSYTCICISGYSGNGSVCTGMFVICLNIICILTIEQWYESFA